MHSPKGLVAFATGVLLIATAGPARPVSAAEAPVVCLAESTTWKLDGSGKKGEVERTRVYVIQGHDERVKALRVVSLFNTYEHHVKSADVRLAGESTRARKWNLDDFQSQPFLRSGSFVSDAELKSLLLRPLQPGDTLSISSRSRIEPFLGFPVVTFADEGITTLRSVLQVRVPSKLNPAYRVWNGAGDPVESVEGDDVVWTWTTGRITPPPEESLGPPLMDLLPTISIGVSKCAWGPSDTWTSLGNSYWEKVSRNVETYDGSIDAPDPMSRLQVCLATVQENVRYVSIALGPGGKIPHKSGETLKRKYGDCKDMAALLLSLLQGGDLDASLALIHTRGPAGLRIDPLPTLQFFNHAAVCGINDGGRYWLDATDNNGTLRTPRRDIQGAPALIVSGPDAGYVRIPLTPAADNRMVRSLALSEERGGTWTGILRMSRTGVFATRTPLALDEPGGSKLLGSYLEDLPFPRRAIRDLQCSQAVRSPDSVCVTGTFALRTLVEAPGAEAGEAIAIPWQTELPLLSLLKSRERRTDLYWPFLHTVTDTVLLTPIDSKGASGSDTTWAFNRGGLEMEVSRTYGPDGLRFVRTVSMTEPVLRVEDWDSAREAYALFLRTSTQPVLLEEM